MSTAKRYENLYRRTLTDPGTTFVVLDDEYGEDDIFEIFARFAIEPPPELARRFPWWLRDVALTHDGSILLPAAIADADHKAVWAATEDVRQRRRMMIRSLDEVRRAEERGKSLDIDYRPFLPSWWLVQRYPHTGDIVNIVARRIGECMPISKLAAVHKPRPVFASDGVAPWDGVSPIWVSH
jgi:hypothetical protein